MKVKVGDRIYDSDLEPVMIILSDNDKKNIANMHPDATKYAVFPDNMLWTVEEMQTWMKHKV